MKPVHKIAPQDWMNAPQTRAVMNALGGSGKARFVGGCVRAAVLDEKAGDVDIATVHLPQEVMSLLQGADIKVIPTGIDHGTVTAVLDGRHFEITTLRKDVETDGRRAVVAYTDDWREDAQRRDFTMNTLLMDLDGQVYDPTGEGLADLQARRVVFVGDPAQRIAEDYLRILRFFRFHAYYGRGEPDAAALAACWAAADKISTLSRERTTQEFFKILAVSNPVSILDLMFDNNVLRAFSFAGYKREIMEKVSALPARLLVLAGLKAENVAAMESLLLIPKAVKKEIDAILKILALPALDNEQAVKIAVYKYGREAATQALLIEQVPAVFAKQAQDIILKWDIPVFPITGEDLIAKGMKPGPELGQKLQELEKAWIENGFKA